MVRTINWPQEMKLYRRQVAHAYPKEMKKVKETVLPPPRQWVRMCHTYLPSWCPRNPSLYQRCAYISQAFVDSHRDLSPALPAQRCKILFQGGHRVQFVLPRFSIMQMQNIQKVALKVAGLHGKITPESCNVRRITIAARIVAEHHQQISKLPRCTRQGLGHRAGTHSVRAIGFAQRLKTPNIRCTA